MYIHLASSKYIDHLNGVMVGLINVSDYETSTTNVYD